MIWFKAFNDRVFCPVNILHHQSSDRFYAIYSKEDAYVEMLSYGLNCTLSHLIVEIWGRVNLGEGALDNMTYEAATMFTLNPEKMIKEITCRNSDTGLQLQNAFQNLSSRPADSIFSELGASSPEEVSLDKVKPDRRELDKIIMGEILGLSDEEQFEVYRAVIDLVKSRLEKAKSFGKRKKTREGIDTDLLVKTVMEKVGDDTLGKFYKEKILSQKPLYTKTLPRLTDDIAVRQSLLGWRLYSGKNYIDCASELEARYLKVWLETGKEEVKVPKDEDYLKTIVPELESLKAKIDDAINAHLGFIANPRTRDRILHRLWQEISKYNI